MAKLPWKFFFFEPPDISHLRIFGCLYYLTLILMINSTLVVDVIFFLGYLSGKKGWHLYLDTHQFFVSLGMFIFFKINFHSRLLFLTIFPPEIPLPHLLIFPLARSNLCLMTFWILPPLILLQQAHLSHPCFWAPHTTHPLLLPPSWPPPHMGRPFHFPSCPSSPSSLPSGPAQFFSPQISTTGPACSSSSLDFHDPASNSFSPSHIIDTAPPPVDFR